MSVNEPSDRSITIWRARRFFLGVIRQQAPEVLEELRALPPYAYRIAVAMNRWNLDPYQLNARLELVFEDDLYAYRTPQIQTLRDNLDYWGETFKLYEAVFNHLA